MEDKMKIDDEIKKVIADKCGISVESVTSDILLSDISNDSISRVEFLFEIEQLIGKKIPEDDIFDVETVGDLLRLVNKIN
jgi:acyl carrier protein